MSNINIFSREVVPTLRNGRQNSGNGSVISSIGFSGSNVDLSAYVKFTGNGNSDLIINGNIVATGDIQAYSSLTGTYSSVFDQLVNYVDGTTVFFTGNKLSASAGAVFPNQTGNAGKFLQTNGTTVSWVSAATDWSSITSKPTTLAGFGITDASLNTHTHTFSSITSKPTTLSGYGITDAQASATAWNNSNLNLSTVDFNAKLLTAKSITIDNSATNSTSIFFKNNGSYTGQIEQYNNLLNINAYGVATYFSMDLSNGNITNTGSVKAPNYKVVAGNSNGIQFWESSDYNIFMSATSSAGYTSLDSDANNDYNLYYKMNFSKRGHAFVTGDGKINLHITNNGVFTKQIQAGQWTNGTAVIDAYGGYAYLGCNTATNGLKIDASGNISTSNILSVGNVVKAQRFTTSDGYPYNTYIGNGADASTVIIEAGSSVGQKSYINVVGKGSPTNPNKIIFGLESTDKVIIDGSGNLTATGDITAFSDRRLKENIKPLGSVIDKLTRIEGVYYNRIESKERKIGLIAQDVENEFPELVNNDGEFKSLNYQNFVAVLLEGIKELKEQIENLKYGFK